MTSGQNLFWFIVGIMTGAAAMMAAHAVFRHLHRRVSGLRVGAAVVGTLSLAAIVAISLYRLWGTPAALTIDTKLAAALSALPNTGVEAASMSTARVGSIEEAAIKLAERLDTQGGTRADWLLLAQSYDFMGRSEDAARAREHAGASAAAAPAAGSAGAASAPGPASAAAKRLAAQAEKYRIAHEYPQAIDAYRRLAQMNGMSADAWANYADATASGNGGKLTGAPGDYLAQALNLDPDHPKALWLQASLLHEQQRYAEAAGVWRHLAKLLPAGSSDAKIIAANIDEAQRLAGIDTAAARRTGCDNPASPRYRPTGAAVQISGEVDIDPTLRAQAGSTSMLFVFAKAPDSPGPPLAVLRIRADHWPMKFLLSDSQGDAAATQGCPIFKRVVVEARIPSAGSRWASAATCRGRVKPWIRRAINRFAS